MNSGASIAPKAMTQIPPSHPPDLLSPLSPPPPPPPLPLEVGPLIYSTEMEVELWNAQEELCCPSNFLISIPNDFCNRFNALFFP